MSVTTQAANLHCPSLHIQCVPFFMQHITVHIQYIIIKHHFKYISSCLPQSPSVSSVLWTLYSGGVTEGTSGHFECSPGLKWVSWMMTVPLHMIIEMYTVRVPENLLNSMRSPLTLAVMQTILPKQSATVAKSKCWVSLAKNENQN